MNGSQWEGTRLLHIDISLPSPLFPSPLSLSPLPFPSPLPLSRSPVPFPPPCAPEQETELAHESMREKVRVAEARYEEALFSLDAKGAELADAKVRQGEAEQRAAQAVSSLYDMEQRIEYEKKRSDGVVHAISTQLNLTGQKNKAALLGDFARLVSEKR